MADQGKIWDPLELPEQPEPFGELILETRVDWLTLTASIARGDGELVDFGTRLAEAYAGTGDHLRNWRSEGYQGYAVAGIAYGVRRDGAILLLSGERARLHWRQALSVPARARRIDLALTSVVGEAVGNVASAIYRDLERDDDGTRAVKTYRYIESNDGGATVYAGSRTSDVYFRVYNKHAESPNEYPERSWRYEAEIKHKTAEQLWQDFQKKVPDAYELGRLVSAYAARVGIDAPNGDNAKHLAWVAPHGATTDQKRLKWLRECVAPAVAWLRTTRTDEEILEALGMQPWEAPILPIRRS